MPPKSVYKYRSGDKNTLDRDLAGLEMNYFWAPNYLNLNDPCETLIDEGNIHSEIDKYSIKFNIAGHGSIKVLKTAATDFIERRKKVGIYSLSKTHKDEILWAHYANSHKGFCIEFDLNLLLNTYDTEIRYPFTVHYVPSPPKTVIEDISSDEGRIHLINKMCATKSTRWEYEEEFRIIVDRPGKNNYCYNALESIYFGIRTSDEVKEKIMERLRGRGVKYYQMILINDSYLLESIPLKDLYDSDNSYMSEIPPIPPRKNPVKFKFLEKKYEWAIEKATITIELEDKIGEKSLKWFANFIHQHLYINAKMIFIFYFFEKQRNREICWATSHIKDGTISVQFNDKLLNL